MIALTSFGVALSPGQESGNTRYSGEIMTRMQPFYQQLNSTMEDVAEKLFDRFLPHVGAQA
jgi:hypothetical protein